LLREVARSLREEMWMVHFAARLGGEQFVVVLHMPRGGAADWKGRATPRTSEVAALDCISRGGVYVTYFKFESKCPCLSSTGYN
jgi:Response regulator containing a CheY-like receiver domain and a GGDEF domain